MGAQTNRDIFAGNVVEPPAQEPAPCNLLRSLPTDEVLRVSCELLQGMAVVSPRLKGDFLADITAMATPSSVAIIATRYIYLFADGATVMASGEGASVRLISPVQCSYIDSLV